MIISVRRIVRGFKLAVMLVVLSICAFQVIALLKQWIQPEVPQVVLSNSAFNTFSEHASEEEIYFSERLKLYYRLGE
ncbi:MAG: DUF4227 family protein [Gorillibacterium sp.]|nr:DUF4227 family protein [Gorillibacterium sp.]